MKNIQFEITSSLLSNFQKLKTDQFFIHSNFYNVINFSNGNILFSLSKNNKLSSLNISTNYSSVLDQIKNSSKNKFYLQFPSLFLSDIKIDLYNCQIINCEIDYLNLPDKNCIDDFCENVLRKDTNNRLISILQGNYGSDIFTKRFNNYYQSLIQSIYKNDNNHFRTLLENIAGFGRGLTPSGDDFLYGMLATWKTFSLKINLRQELEIFILNNTSKFNLISYNFLISLTDGFIFPTLKSLFQKLSTKKDYTNELDDLFKHGFSSGMDMLFGIITALKNIE